VLFHQRCKSVLATRCRNYACVDPGTGANSGHQSITLSTKEVAARGILGDMDSRCFTALGYPGRRIRTRPSASVQWTYSRVIKELRCTGCRSCSGQLTSESSPQALLARLTNCDALCSRLIRVVGLREGKYGNRDRRSHRMRHMQSCHRAGLGDRSHPALH